MTTARAVGVMPPRDMSAHQIVPFVTSAECLGLDERLSARLAR